MNMRNIVYIILCAISVVCASCSGDKPTQQQKETSSLYTKEAVEYIDHLGEYSTKDMKKYQYESPASYNFLSDLANFISSMGFLFKILFILIICVVLVLLVLNFKRSRSSNSKNKTVNGSATAELLDTIYGHDWAREIEQAKAEGEWGKAIMLVYLNCLYNLDSKSLITWKDSKTPTEYYYELKADKYRKPLYNLTMLYFRARYADVVADESMFNSAMQEQKRIGNEN